MGSQYMDIIYQNTKLRKQVKEQDLEIFELERHISKLNNDILELKNKLHEEILKSSTPIYEYPIERMVRICSSVEDLKKIMDYMNEDIRNTVKLEEKLNEIVR